MKSEKGVGRSRNGRLNQARRYAIVLDNLLAGQQGTSYADPIQDATFWGNVREFSQKITKCIHEANAYNNCMLDDGETSDAEEYQLTDLGKNIAKRIKSETNR